MKIGRVYNNISYASQWEKKNPYLYTAQKTAKKESSMSFKEHKLEYLGGFLALVSAGIALSKFLTRNKTPKNIVEVADKALGLNKVKGCPRTIAQVKEAILYPMMSVMNGEKRPLRGDFKTGLIIGGKNQEKVTDFIAAFTEHCKELRIHCVEVNTKKSNRLKEVHKAIDKAIEYHKATGECVVVNIGDLAAVSNHNIAKTDYSSRIEERLALMPKGVLWTSYTTQADNLPYFYNNIPTLCVKI